MPVHIASTHSPTDPALHSGPLQGAADYAVVSEEDRLRAGTYRVLARLLADIPGDDVLDPLRALDADTPGTDGPLAAAWQLLATAAGAVDAGELDDEYHALFIGIGRGELVPYASWYRTGFLMEKPLAELRGELRALGFAPREGVKEPEDHAAALCEVMSELVEEDARLERAPGPAQRGFFTRHIEPWMARLFSDMQMASSARFYRAVGQLGQEFIQVETEYLAMSD